MLQMRSWISDYDMDVKSKEASDIPIAPSLYSLSNKLDNSLLAVRVINHKLIVVGGLKLWQTEKKKFTNRNQ